MFRLVHKRLAVNRELESLKQEFNQCSLPIEFVHRTVVACVDEIMERGLNHPFILKNPYPPSVVAALVTLMLDPERRDLFSLKCTRIDTVAGVMLAVLKNLREAIVPLEIQDELTSVTNHAIATGGFTNLGTTTPTSGNKINTVDSLLNHPNFPSVNRALLIELLNLSLAILNRSSFNRVKPDMLASVLGPYIFTTQHATILQHTPQQAYSFGWGVALVNDIKRCSKMFYVLLGGYRRQVLGPDDWEDYGLNSAVPSGLGMLSGPALPANSSRGQVRQWLGSTATIHGVGGMGSAGSDPEEDQAYYLGHSNRHRLHQSVPQLRIVTENVDSPRYNRGSLSQYGMVRNVSTTLTESIRAAAAQEAKQWNVRRSNSGSKGPAALEHLRGSQHGQQQQHSNGYSRESGGSWNSRQQKPRTVEQRQQDLFQHRFKGDYSSGTEGMDELSQVLRRHNIRGSGNGANTEDDGSGRMDDIARQREEKRLAIELMIRSCRGTGLGFTPREGEAEGISKIDSTNTKAPPETHYTQRANLTHMLVGPRFTALLLLVTGGLLLASMRYRSNQQSENGSLQGMDNDYGEDLDTANDHYHYCQAQRPSLRTYPSPKVQGSSLVHSQLFVRHGDRTPIIVLPLDVDISWDCTNTSTYSFSGVSQQGGEPFQYANVIAHQVVSIPPASPFAATNMWKGNCIPGQLTSVGALQHRRLGAALRRIYVGKYKLLPATYDPEVVQIRSTDVWRTKQSAENFMAGMYGIPGQYKRNSLPVLQIHTQPSEIEYLYMNDKVCPRMNQLRAEAQKSSTVLKKLHQDNVDFQKELIDILGAKRPWTGYMDTVLPRVCHDRPLQCRKKDGVERCINSSITERILENVEIQTAEIYRDMKGMFEVLQLGIGPVANDIKQNLLAAKDNGKVRFQFYSGHDTTIAPILGMLDAEDMRWPPYASNILIELWKTPKGNHFVRVLYNHMVLETASGWCDLEWCPLDDFVAYLDRFILKDLISHCQL
ncbi:unnamed protein product [Mortierella alpina]